MTDLVLNNFEEMARAVLAFLCKRFAFNLWMVTRTEGEDWIVLQVEDRGYGVQPGNVYRWADSFCFHMVKGEGPHIAPNSDLVPAYAAAPIGRQVPIRAYVGFPLLNSDGSLFGTLCAIDPSPQPEELLREQELLALLAAMLSGMLSTELRATAALRTSERLEAEAQTDALTQLYNRRAWERFMAREETRCARYGHPAAVLSIDLNELKQVNDSQGHAAGDDLIKRAADALRSATREADIVARLGGDEFGVIAVECDAQGAQALLARIRQAFTASDVKASIGLSRRTPALGLQAAFEEADQRMYVEKRAR